MGLRRAPLTLMLIAVLIASCGGGDGADEVEAAATNCADDGGAGPYFLYERDGWEFRGGADYPADADPLARVEPSLDWFVEYERFTRASSDATVEGVSLRLSGHEIAIDDQREELVGFRTEGAEIAGRSAYTGVSPEGEPTVVGMAVDDAYTIMLLSYGLGLDELIEAASHIEQACQAAWIEAGGRVLTCDPLDPDCDPPPSSSTSVPASTTSLSITTTTRP